MYIDAAVRAAVDFGYKCTVAHDACAAMSFEFNDTSVPANQVHAAFMGALKLAYAEILATQDIIATL